jgi:hypothetical protein
MGSARIAAVSLLACAALLAGCGGPKSEPLANCTEGESCTPANSCHQGRVSCATGTAVCADALATVLDGTGCGSGLVCLSGLCGAPCVPDQACTATNPCRLAMTTCATATSAPACTETGDLADGTSCGDGVVCRGGACTPACQGGLACEPPNPCTIGVSSCPTTASDAVCILTANKEDGTSCGEGQVCSAGSCVTVTCQAGAACQPADPCRNGVVACTSPLSPGTCATSTTKDDGASCGTGQVCATGQCIGPPVIESLTASLRNVRPDSSVMLWWTVTGATQVTLDPGGATLYDWGAAVSPAQTTVYTLTAANAAGSTSASVTVTVSTIQHLWIYCGPDHVDTSVRAGGAIRFSSVFQVGAGDPGLDIDWSVEAGGGTVTPEPGGAAIYLAPRTPGRYRVTGVSSWDPTRQDECWITVTGGAGTFVSAGSVTFGGWGQATASLRDGSVLVAGGYRSGFWNDEAAVYDPDAGRFTATGRMSTQRGFATATGLPDGRVLVAGGRCGGDRACVDPGIAELYDPSTGRFWQLGRLVTGRIEHTATTLPDGRILLAGGGTSTAELFDPAQGAFVPTGELRVARSGHTATLLSSGEVLVAGGRDPTTWGALQSAELYDPRTGTFADVGPMVAPRDRHTATLLPSGLVLIAGGNSSSTELYDPARRAFAPAATMIAVRTGHTATLLESGLVLVAGGEFLWPHGSLLRTAELYDPGADAFTVAGPMVEGRWRHTAVRLLDGRALLIAGECMDHDCGLDDAELYQP